jgi:drug/metabolite transporter (DMT)-like permease
MATSSTLTPAQAALLGSLAMALLTLMDAFIKAASGPFSAVQILWLRFALTALLSAGLLILWGTPWPTRKTWPQHLLRAALMIVSNGAFIYALGALPLAEVFALALTAPVFLAALGAIMLKEKLTTRTLLGLALGSCGMLTIVFAGTSGGGTSHPPLALLAALVAPVTYAISLVLLRQQATGEAPMQVVFIQALLVTAIVTPALPFTTWSSAIQAPHWPTLLAIGVTSTAGYLILVKALTVLTAVRYSVIEYTGLVWAALIGWLWFAERPTLPLALGSALIVAGAMVSVLQREAAKN